MNKESDLKCPKCNSSQTRCRVKTGDRICYFCGNIYQIEKEKEVTE